ncbi:MAG: DUF2911 domain-containing protein, partial [Acidobacteriota bacterium]
MRNAAILALCILSATALLAEEAKKPLSPPAKAEATLNGKKVTIDYSAPSKRNRVIMGELVPYGKVWRTGANAATTLTTETTLMLGTLHVPPGTYTLYTIPGEKEWTLIVNKQTGQWGTNYDEKQDLGRTKMTVSKVKQPVETFVIGVDKSTLNFTWENT